MRAIVYGFAFALAWILFAALFALAAPAHACDAFVGGCGTGASRTIISSPSFVAAKIIGRRPRGCPHRYCGCAISLRVFGRIIPDLNLAWNWAKKFPRTSPAPGMVAARRGHVMQLIAHVKGSRWRVYDPNSGGGKTRIHVRSLKGFAVVNPHARSVARLGRGS